MAYVFKPQMREKKPQAVFSIAMLAVKMTLAVCFTFFLQIERGRQRKERSRGSIYGVQLLWEEGK